MKLFNDFRSLVIKNFIIQNGLDNGVYLSFEDMCKQYTYEFGDFLPNQSLMGKYITVINGSPAMSEWVNKIHKYIGIDITALTMLNTYINELGNSINNDMTSKMSIIKALLEELSVRISTMKSNMSNPIGTATTKLISGSDIDVANSDITYKSSKILPAIDYNKSISVYSNILDSYFSKSSNSNISNVVNLGNDNKASVSIKVPENTSSGKVSMFIRFKDVTLVNNIEFIANNKFSMSIDGVVSGSTIAITPMTVYNKNVTIAFTPMSVSSLILNIITTSKTRDGINSKIYDEFYFELKDFNVFSKQYKEISKYESNIITLDNQYNKIGLIGNSEVPTGTSLEAFISSDNKVSWNNIILYNSKKITNGSMSSSVSGVSLVGTADVIDVGVLSKDIKSEMFALTTALTAYDLSYIKQLNFTILRGTNTNFSMIRDGFIYVPTTVDDFDFETYPIYLDGIAMFNGDSIDSGIFHIHYDGGLSSIQAVLEDNSIVLGSNICRYSEDKNNLTDNQFSITINDTSNYILIKRKNSADWENEGFLVIKNNINNTDLDNMPQTVAVKLILHSDGVNIPSIQNLGVITL